MNLRESDQAVMPMNKPPGNIKAILCDYLEQSHKGEGAAISSKELERILHVKGTVIRRLVNNPSQ